MLHAGARRVAILGVVLTSVLTGACSETRRPETADAGARGAPALTTGRRVTPAAAVETGEDLRPGTRGWRLSRPARQGQIEGYATTSSGLPGDPVALRVSTRAATYRVLAYRFGAYAGGDAHRCGSRRGSRAASSPAHASPTPAGGPSSRRGARASSWTPTGGHRGSTCSSWPPRPAGRRTCRTSSARRPRWAAPPLVFPVTTWQAYNDWGGYSLYKGAGVDRRSWAVSFDRPYPAPGAAEMLFGAMPVAVAAERTGVPLAFFTNVDLDRRPDALTGATAYVSTGHDEYWTAGMRARSARPATAGTNLAFLGANTMYWRVRLRTRAGSSSATGPTPRSTRLRRAQRTGQWRDAERSDRRTS